MKIIERSDHADRLLEPFRGVLDPDFEGYRGHVHRVLTYALHFLGGDETHRRAIEAALVYHDIGVWTDRTLAYLEPSIRLALSANEAEGWGIEPTLLENIIHWHHKVFPYQGPHSDVVNAVRKADWIDASGGKLRKGLDGKDIEVVMAAIPDAGFHDALMRLASELGGGSKARGFGRLLYNVYKW